VADRDPYAILGVAPVADGEEIVLACRSLARRYHPDVSSDPGAQDHMAAINGACAILRDPVKRAEWDREHRREAHGAGHTVWRRGPDGEGAAGPPPGPRMGTVLPFGRHIGWSIGEIARADPGYLVWLMDRREAAPYRAEIERVLGAMPNSPLRPPQTPPRQSRWG